MRFFSMLYSIMSYLFFFAVFLYFMGFVGDLVVTKTLSAEVTVSALNALIVNIGLLLLWGVQHSVMARGWFKDMIEPVIPHYIERSTYVLVSGIVLAILMHFWQPMAGIIWQVENPTAINCIWGLFALGWIFVLLSTFLTDHFDLFGLRQSWLHFVKRTYTPVIFTEVLFYRWIRHPMMLGMFIVFWTIPTMTTGHLVFSIGMSIYILLGMHFEEKGLAKTLGKNYLDYQQRTSKVIPKVY
ncbi:MAG: isoprenylcysteine carboxylmethyltransferase family protein [Pseudomonadales bacterium]|nr:isoprenylcysteine carboxylmethyltransferase family protein [Pseudomonadales bacterium]